METGSDILLDVRDLTVALPQGAERPNAVESVSLRIARNEILCVVGESGSGKSMTAHAVMGLLPRPHVRVTGGEIAYRGRDILTMGGAEQRGLRGDRIAMIFQEPMTALNLVGEGLNDALNPKLARKGRA